MNPLSKAIWHIKDFAENTSFHYFIHRLIIIVSRRSFIPDSIGSALERLYMRRYNFIERYLQPLFTLNKEEAFLDVGANIGGHTRIVASRCRRVYAWEPNPITYKLLSFNTRRLRNVTCIPEALGMKEEILPLKIHESLGLCGFVNETGSFMNKHVSVKVKPLDSYSFPMKIGLIKVDTEGFEVPIIQGAEKTIRKHKPKLILEMHPPFVDNALKIQKLLPHYRFRRVYRPKGNQDSQFHLIGISNV